MRKLTTVMLAVLMLIVAAGLANAQSKTFFWNRLDVDITVLPNSDFRVVETWQATFTSGSFTFAYRDVPMDRVGGITAVSVSEGNRNFSPTGAGPYTFSAYRSEGKMRIRFNFPPTSDSTHTYTIAYTVNGGLRFYTGGDQLWWKAVFPDRDFPVNASRVTVNLPERATADVVASYGAKATYQILNPQKVVFTATEAIPPGQELEVRVQFPHGVVAGSAAGWQQLEDRKPMINVAGLVVGLLILFGGMAMLYMLWYTRGRDVPVGAIAEYLPEPPSGLSPGLAGTLLDERADMQDIIATLVDLARRGVITMREEEEPGLFGIGTHRDFTFEYNQDPNDLASHEKLLISSLFGVNKSRQLSDLKNKFYKDVPALQSELYAGVVREGFFPSSPQTTRTIYQVLGFVLLAVGFGATFLLGATLARYGALLVFPPIALGVLGIAMLIVGSFMPRRTPLGAEANARWKAFRRYLENIDRYADLQQVKDIFDRFLPYAIAFGLEKSWVSKFERVDAPAPGWFIPYGLPHHYGPHSMGGLGGSSASGPRSGREGGGGLPSLDTGAGRAFGSLNAMSAGLFSMLNSTASTMGSRPSSSGSGGGFSGGGGGGGGGFG